jgi:hypothetical protein
MTVEMFGARLRVAVCQHKHANPPVDRNRGHQDLDAIFRKIRKETLEESLWASAYPSLEQQDFCGEGGAWPAHCNCPAFLG